MPITVKSTKPSRLDKIKRFRNEVDKCLQLASDMYNIDLSSVKVTYDLTGKASGQAGRRDGKLFMRFNMEAVEKYTADMIENTLPHEVAHLVGFKTGAFRNHDHGWKRACRQLGGNGERCHNYQLTSAKNRTRKRFVYMIERAGEILVGPKHHAHVMKGGTLRWKPTGEQINAAHYERKIRMI